LTRFARQVDIVEYKPEVKASWLLQEKGGQMTNMRVDVNSGSTKQADSAAGEGATAALMMREYLKDRR
jgi:alkyl hydroperoxide reductase subunit AhpF